MPAATPPGQMNTKDDPMTETTTISFAALPAMGSELEGGKFVGVTTLKDGTHAAMVLLPNFEPDWYWTADTHGASYAWLCDFYLGNQYDDHGGSEGCVRAVRLIHLTA
jgi:hypothetical protein